MEIIFGFLLIFLIIVAIIWYAFFRKKSIIEPDLDVFIVKRIHPSNYKTSDQIQLAFSQSVLGFDKDTFIGEHHGKPFNIRDFLAENNLDGGFKNNVNKHFYLYEKDGFTGIENERKIDYMVKCHTYDIVFSIHPQITIDYIIENPETFMHTMVLYKDVYTPRDFLNQMNQKQNGVIVREILEYLNAENIALPKAIYHLDELESIILLGLNTFYQDKGLKISQCILHDITFKQTKATEYFNKMMLKKARYQILNYTYQDEKKVEFLNANNLKITDDKTTKASDLKPLED